MIRDVLTRIVQNYRQASSETFASHPLADYLRTRAPRAIAGALGNKDFTVSGSPGQGQWATIPWIAVFYPPVTNKASFGHYVVYLFSEDMARVCVSLNQAVTPFEKEFKSKAYDKIVKRANSLREQIPNLPSLVSETSIQLSVDGNSKFLYEAGHIFGRTYNSAALPSEEALLKDLQELLKAYLCLSHNGEATINYETFASELEREPNTVDEVRKYGLHRRIERNPNTSQKVKANRKPVCDACGFEFISKYGELGSDFIEVHHKKPLSDLPENTTFSFDIYLDFDVLCSNCHRMIHRTEDPSDLDAFKALICAQKTK